MGFMSQLLYTGAEFMHDLGNLTVIIVGAAGAMMTLYAIYIGFLFATASDANKRKAARERLYKVVGSAFIIIGLAIVLGTINVRFNKVEGSVTDTNNGTNGNFSSQYSYGESVSMTLNYTNRRGTTQGTMVILDGSKIKKDGKLISTKKDTVQFLSCDVIAPSDWTNISKNPFDIRDTKAIYNFEIEGSTVYGTMVNKNICVSLKVSFTLSSDTSKTYSMKVNVLLVAGTGVTLLAK